MKKSITMKAMRGRPVSMAIVDEMAQAQFIDGLLDRILDNGVQDGDDLTLLECIAICEAQMAKAAS